MKKLILLVAIALLGLGFLPSHSHALTTELVSEQGTTAVYNIIANPPEESSAIQLRFSITGGTITSVETGRMTLLQLGTCENSAVYFENRVCTDIASSEGNIVDGETVAVVTIEKEPSAEIVFDQGPDHAYLTVNDQIVAEDGTLLQDAPEIEPTQSAVTPEAQTNDDSSLPLYLLIGILIILIGAFVAILFFSDRASEKSTRL